MIRKIAQISESVIHRDRTLRSICIILHLISSLTQISVYYHLDTCQKAKAYFLL